MNEEKDTLAENLEEQTTMLPRKQKHPPLSWKNYKLNWQK